jgi:hypothetical protein
MLLPATAWTWWVNYVGTEEKNTSGVIKKSTLFNNTKLQQMKHFNILHIVYMLILTLANNITSAKCKH